MPDGYIVSLGDSGVADVTFAGAIYNGPGADFAVFENGFLNATNDSLAFLELAFVEVKLRWYKTIPVSRLHRLHRLIRRM